MVAYRFKLFIQENINWQVRPQGHLLHKTSFGSFILEKDHFGFFENLAFGENELWFFMHTMRISYLMGFTFD